MARRGDPGSSERGAVSTIVVVLLTYGVLLGFLALTVDVGRTVLERRELQNGADAGALALAQACAGPEEVCDPEAQWLADLVNANAGDGEHAFAVCGTAPELDDCVGGTSIEDITVCPPLPEHLAGTWYVEVHAETLSDGGESILPNLFGGSLQGEAADLTVNTCARAAWGPPATTGPTLPMTISRCGWESLTDFGADLAPSPPYSPPASASGVPPVSPVPLSVDDHVVSLLHRTADSPGGCDPDAPALFAWLDDGPEGRCEAVFEGLGGAVGGAGPSCDRNEMLRWVGTEVLVPVYAQVDDDDDVAQYTFSGVAGFYLAGWQDVPELGDSYGVYTDTGQSLCRSDEVDDGGGVVGDDAGADRGCLWGWFTSPVVSFGAIDPTAEGLGVVTVQMAG